MKTVLKLIVLALCLLFQMPSANAQEKDIFILHEYVESEKATYIFQAYYQKNEDNQFSEVSIYVSCHPGEKKDFETEHNGAFKVDLSVVDVEKKKMNLNLTEEELNDKNQELYSYILKTKYKTHTTDVDKNSCDGLGMLQVKLGFANQVTIYNNILILTIGDNDLTFKRFHKAQKIEVKDTKSKGEKYLEQYGEMDYLFFERDKETKQLNQMIATVKQDETGQFIVRVNFNVWDSKKKKKIGDMLGAFTMNYEVEKVELSDNSDTPLVYLTCKKPVHTFEKSVTIDFDGYYFGIFNALKANTKWTLTPGGSISFNTGRNDFYIARIYNHDRLKYKR